MPDTTRWGVAPQMTDVIGYAASIAVLATFTVRNMLPLRMLAIVSNVRLRLRSPYSSGPTVHLALLPINLVRLAGLMPRSIRVFHKARLD